MSFICKAESISHGGAAVKYAENKQVDDVSIANEFERNMIGGSTPAECWHEMVDWKQQTGHGNIKRDCLWITFAPSVEMCKQLDEGGKAEWDKAYHSFLKEMNLENTMRLAVRHERTEAMEWRPHLHIAMSRIDLDGNVISDHLIGLKAKAAAEKLSRQYDKKIAAEMDSEKKQFARVAREELGKMQTFDMRKFLDALNGRGYETTAKEDSKGIIRGWTVDMPSGQSFKISEIDRTLCASKINKEYQKERSRYVQERMAKERAAKAERDKQREAERAREREAEQQRPKRRGLGRW